MPEPFDQQPSFTSSTYQVIASDAPLTPNSDRPLSEQPDIQAFLYDSSAGPIPEIVLYRLLTVAELALKQKFPDKQLGGLCLGYTLEPIDIELNDPDDSGNLFYVSWGAHSTYSELLKPTIDTSELESSEEPESLQLSSEEAAIDTEFSVLKDLIEAEIARSASKDFLKNKQPYAFLFGHFNNNLHSFRGLEASGRLSSERIETSAMSSNNNAEIKGDFPCNCRRTKKPNARFHKDKNLPTTCGAECPRRTTS